MLWTCGFMNRCDHRFRPTSSAFSRPRIEIIAPRERRMFLGAIDLANRASNLPTNALDIDSTTRDINA